jgi:ArsR family transcriptional regulator
MDNILKSIKAVSEEIRMRVLLLLVDREACVCELMEVFDMAQSKLSHHLITLHKAGLLQGEKRGKWHYYRVNTADLSKKNSEVLRLLSRSLAGNKLVEKDRRSLAAIRRRKMICIRRNMNISNKMNVQKGKCSNE